MRKGKVKCEILKAIRKEIAAANNIPFEPRLCRHQGDCLGTCPACEGEIRYLENKLSDMEASGRRCNQGCRHWLSQGNSEKSSLQRFLAIAMVVDDIIMV